MNNLKRTVLVVLISTALWAAAAAPVAVRVEVEPLGPEAGGTRVALTVQVSPEDRSRIGKNAMLRIELDGDVPPGQSPLWAVRIENDGSGRIETVWPAGEHALSVEISNPSGQDTGLWVGTVRVPGSGAGPVKPADPPSPEGATAAVDAAESAAVAAAAGGSTPVEPPEASMPTVTAPVETGKVDTEPSGVQAPESSPDSGATAVIDEMAPVEREPEIAAAVAAAPEPGGPRPDPPAGGEPVPDVVAEEETDRAGAAAAATAAGAAAATGEKPEADVGTEGPESTAAVEKDLDVAPEPVAVEPETIAVEPLRSETAPAPGGEPTAPGVAAAAPSIATSEPPAAEMAEALEGWAKADPATTDLTVVVFRGREPATGLGPSDFRVRVGGVDVTVEAVGDATGAPLQLGIAVDVAAGSGANWQGSGGRLSSLVERAAGWKGHLFFATDGRVGDWDGEAEAARGGYETAPGGGLTSLLTDSLARFEGRRGRTFLVVVTDGRIDADKAAWKSATEAAANSGVPVLVIALWDENFSHRIRKNLKDIADVSGGGLFLVQGSDQLDRAAERFGPIIDAGVALRVTPPPGVTLPASVSVETGDRSLEVTAPKGVR